MGDDKRKLPTADIRSATGTYFMVGTCPPESKRLDFPRFGSRESDTFHGPVEFNRDGQA